MYLKITLCICMYFESHFEPNLNDPAILCSSWVIFRKYTWKYWILLKHVPLHVSKEDFFLFYILSCLIFYYHVKSLRPPRLFLLQNPKEKWFWLNLRQRGLVVNKLIIRSIKFLYLFYFFYFFYFLEVINFYILKKFFNIIHISYIFIVHT